MARSPEASPRQYVLRPLEDSVFNYPELHEERFIHYCRLCRMMLRSGARRVLEIGPGDHLVTDFPRRKGVDVRTLDSAAGLYPDYPRDIRNPWNLAEKFDAILAAEVFEHLPFRYLDGIVDQAADHLVDGGYFLVSLPYSTIPLFPRDKRYGSFQSPMGRLPTGIPMSAVQGLLTVVRGVYRFCFLRYTWKGSFRYFRLHSPEDENNTSIHHWGVGYKHTDNPAVRRVFAKRFEVINETSDCSVLNVKYYEMPKRAVPQMNPA